MRVKIPIEFEVEAVDEEVEAFEESVAKQAAETAAWDYLSLVTVSGVNTDTEKVTVHVDGFGECRVKIGEEHG